MLTNTFLNCIFTVRRSTRVKLVEDVKYSRSALLNEYSKRQLTSKSGHIVEAPRRRAGDKTTSSGKQQKSRSIDKTSLKISACRAQRKIGTIS